MTQICSCRGLIPNCPICHAPKRRAQPRLNPTQIVLQRALRLFAASQNWEVVEIDISAWNGTMDIGVTKTKAQAGFIRLGYGNQWKDYRCDENRQKALDHDWPYGVYWYCRPGESWMEHANAFADIAAEYPFQLDMIIDAEQTSLGKQATLDWLMSLDGRLRSLTGAIPKIYTGKGFWDGYVARSTYFSDRRNWLAHWTNADWPLTPLDLPFVKGGHWQWSADGNGKGREYGGGPDGDNDMDLNRYYGTVDEFNAQYGTHITQLGDTPPDEPPSEIVPLKLVTSTGYPYLNIRSKPSGTDIGNLMPNSLVPVVEEDGDWYRIEGWIHKGYTK